MVTPNDDFYRIDTALVVPQVDPRTYVLEVDGMVLGGRLRVTWSYSGELFDGSTVTALAGRSIAVLEQLIDHRDDAAPDRGADHLSDVPLTQRQLDDLLAGLGTS